MSEGFSSQSLEWEEIDLYRFFAFVFRTPSQALFDWLRRPATAPALTRLWRILGMEGPAPPLRLFGDYEEYEAGYIGLFDVGLPEPPVPLVESFHRKDIPPQQTVLENTDFYEVVGLRPEWSVTPPDHLVTQMEFLSSVRYLQDNCKDKEQFRSLVRLERDFLARHLLSWVPAAQAKIEALGPPVFPLFFALLLRFLRSRREQLSL